jgi:hypothetical protein
MHRIFPTDVKELKIGGEYNRARAKGKWLFFKHHWQKLKKVEKHALVLHVFPTSL